METSQRRKFFRLEISVPVEVLDSLGRKYSFQTHDLSAGGMNIISKGAFPINAPLRVRLQIEKDFIASAAVVKWIKPVPDKQMWSMGIEFVKLDEAQQEKITKFLNAKMLELRRKGLI